MRQWTYRPTLRNNVMDSIVASDVKEDHPPTYARCFNVRHRTGYRALVAYWTHVTDGKGASFAAVGVKEGIMDAGLWPAKSVRAPVYYAGGSAYEIPPDCLEGHHDIYTQGDHGDWHINRHVAVFVDADNTVYCKHADLDFS